MIWFLYNFVKYGSETKTHTKKVNSLLGEKNDSIITCHHAKQKMLQLMTTIWCFRDIFNGNYIVRDCEKMSKTIMMTQQHIKFTCAICLNEIIIFFKAKQWIGIVLCWKRNWFEVDNYIVHWIYSYSQTNHNNILYCKKQIIKKNILMGMFF